MATTEVKVPDIGDFDEVAVIELLVKVGDKVRPEQSLITVESDKASMEIPSSHAGVITEMLVKLGDKVKQGSLIVRLDAGETAAAASPAPAAITAVKPAALIPAAVAEHVQAVPAPTDLPLINVAASSTTPQAGHQPTMTPAGDVPHASPSIRKFARELGVPLAEVKGTGPKGRIGLEDIHAFSRSVMAGDTRTQAQATKATSGDGAGLGLIPWPKVDFLKFGPIERKAMGRIQKISAANLLRNAIMIPAVTNHDDADITELEAFRVLTNKDNEKSGVKVTMLAFLIKACVSALQKFSPIQHFT